MTQCIEVCQCCHHTLPTSSYNYPWEGSIVRAYSMPSEANKAAIQARIDNVHAELAMIDSQMVHFHDITTALALRRRQTVNYCLKARIYISPSAIRHAMLPPEIYGIIFQLACQDLGPNAIGNFPTSLSAEHANPTSSLTQSALNPIERPPSPAVNALRTIFTISSVCHHWRQIALGHPDLWSYIRVSPHTPLELVHLYLQRSGSRPLELEISTSSPLQFSPLLAACHRWKVVYLAHDYFPIGDGPIFSMLTTLVIGKMLPARLPSWSRHEQFPVLRKLCIVDMNSNWSVNGDLGHINLKIHWPWISRVVSSSIGFCSNKDLAAVPCVEFIYDGRPWTGLLQTDALHVTSLVLGGSIWDELHFFYDLEKIHLTRLDNLDIDFPGDLPDIARWISAFANLLQRSKCRITSLSLSMTRMTTTALLPHADHLFALLDECEWLRCLTIIEGAPGVLTNDLVDELLSVTVNDDGPPAYLPNLVETKLVWAGIMAHSALSRNLPLRIGSASAVHGVKPLEKVVLGVRNALDVQPEICALLADLRKSGVEATLW